MWPMALSKAHPGVGGRIMVVGLPSTMIPQYFSDNLIVLDKRDDPLGPLTPRTYQRTDRQIAKPK